MPRVLGLITIRQGDNLAGDTFRFRIGVLLSNVNDELQGRKSTMHMIHRGKGDYCVPAEQRASPSELARPDLACDVVVNQLAPVDSRHVAAPPQHVA